MSIMIMSAVVAAPIGFIITLLSSRVTIENANSFKLIGLEHAKVNHEEIVLNETMDLCLSLFLMKSGQLGLLLRIRSALIKQLAINFW